MSASSEMYSTCMLLFLPNRILFTQSNKNLMELFENLNALNSYKASLFLLFTKHPKQSEHKQIIPDTGHVLITWLVIRLIYTTRWRFGLVRKVLQSVHWILFYFKGTEFYFISKENLIDTITYRLIILILE